jgi:hypothetical protein
MENQVLSFDEIKKLFPDEWVLLGNPEYGEDHTPILFANVVAHHKDKRELALSRPDWRKSFDTATCVYTGIFPPKRTIGVMIRREI